MIFNRIKEDCYYFSGAVNIGYINNGKDYGLLIDAGIDQQTMKRVLKKLQEVSLPVTHLFVTHAHADHYGGAAYLQKVKNVFTYAPEIESAILSNPILEPLYLFQGNLPLPEMRNKFLEGKPIQVDQIVEEGNVQWGETRFECIALPGHSINQYGLLIHDIFYAADGYFSKEQLIKHKIPYIIDGDQTIKSLVKINEIICEGAVPGHGVFEKDFQKTVEENITWHLHIAETLRTILKGSGKAGISHDQIVCKMCEHFNVSELTLSTWMLYRTAITAYLTLLVKKGEAELFINKYNLYARFLEDSIL